jgi:hypothetical protein
MPAGLEGCLADETLREFFAGWADVVAVIERVKAGSAGGGLIQYLKIPQSASESLAARILLREGVSLEATRIVRGGGADLSVREGRETRLVGVKGSGSSEFQTLGRKDYLRHMLVWLRFGEARLLGPSGVVRATLFPQPIKCFGDLGARIVYSAAETAAVRNNCDIRRIEVPLETLLDA